jgi:hypothetical protein
MRVYRKQTSVFTGHAVRLPGMRASPTQQGFFDRARAWAATGLFIASGLAVVGAAVDWVTITPPPRLPLGELPRTDPYTGLEAGDGWWVLGAGIALALLATLLVLRSKSFYAWLAFLVAILIGGIAFSDFNAVGDSSSELWRRMDRVGDVDAGLGLTLVAAAGVIGVIASAAGVAATPRQDAD